MPGIIEIKSNYPDDVTRHKNAMQAAAYLEMLRAADIRVLINGIPKEIWGLAYDKKNHTYTVCGAEYPSVTAAIGIMDNFLAIRRTIEAIQKYHPMSEDIEAKVFGCVSYVPQDALDRGTFLHRACQLDLEDDLDYAAQTAYIRSRIDAWREFVQKFKVDTTYTIPELHMVSTAYGYAGTPDYVCPKLWPGEFRAVVVYLTESGYKLGPEVTDEHFIDFRCALNLYTKSRRHIR